HRNVGDYRMKLGCFSARCRSLGRLAVLIALATSVSPLARAEEPLVVRVQVLNFDHRVPSEDNRLLREVLRFHNPHELASTYAKDVLEASGGFIKYEIVAWKDVDEIPVKEDGFRYTPDRLLELWGSKGPWHEPDRMDYMRVLTEHVDVEQVDRRLV